MTTRSDDGGAGDTSGDHVDDCVAGENVAPSDGTGDAVVAGAGTPPRR